MLPHQAHAFRQQFPALRAGEVVYLDNASGAQLPDRVIDAVVDAMRTMQVNKGGAYAPSRRITERKEQVRHQTLAFLQAPAGSTLAFGLNATTLLNLLASALGDSLQPGDEIITTHLDHQANIDPWASLVRRGVEVKRWRPRAPEMRLHLDDLKRLLTPRTRWVAFTAASNALGTLTEVKSIAALVRGAGARSMVDLVHYAPHFRPELARWGVDAAVFSPYKVFAPHLGALFLTAELRESLPAPKLSFMASSDPVAWEPGTASHEAMVGWGAALSYLAELGRAVDPGCAEPWNAAFAAIAEHERSLATELLSGLDALGCVLYGVADVEGRTATVAFNHPDLSAQKVAEHLGEAGVAVAAGHYYAHHLMFEELGLAERGGAVRASALHYTSAGDIDALCDALRVL